MTSEHRQRMNVRAIRVTLTSALRHVAPEQKVVCVDRARQLLAHSREDALTAAVVADIDALEAQLPSAAVAEQRES